MVSCPFGFVLSDNANRVTGIYHAWRHGDRFFAFSCFKKDQNNTVNMSEWTSSRAVETLSGKSTKRLNRTKLLRGAPAYFLKRSLYFLTKSAIAKLCVLVHKQGLQEGGTRGTSYSGPAGTEVHKVKVNMISFSVIKPNVVSVSQLPVQVIYI